MNEEQQEIAVRDAASVERLKLVHHETPESIVCAYFGNEPTVEDIAEGTLSQKEEDGSETRMLAQQMLDEIRDSGYWGFSLRETDEVHVWVGPNARRSDLLFFLAHEIGHTLWIQEEDEVAEEERAQTYGAATMLADGWTQELLKASATKRHGTS